MKIYFSQWLNQKISKTLDWMCVYLGYCTVSSQVQFYFLAAFFTIMLLEGNYPGYPVGTRFRAYPRRCTPLPWVTSLAIDQRRRARPGRQFDAPAPARPPPSPRLVPAPAAAPGPASSRLPLPRGAPAARRGIGDGAGEAARREP